MNEFEYYVWADGGNRDNTDFFNWDAYGSFLVSTRDPPTRSSYTLTRIEFGPRSNNEAEYLALINALSYLCRICAPNAGSHRIRIYTDSELVRKQVIGEWKVKKELLRWYRERAVSLIAQFKRVEIVHLGREQIFEVLGH